MATQLDLRGRRPATVAALVLAAAATAWLPQVLGDPGHPSRVDHASAVTPSGPLTPGADAVPGTVAAGLAAAAPAGAAPATLAPGTPAPARSPLDALQPGVPPATVPYAIGTRVYFQGRITDVSTRFAQAFPGRSLPASQRQLTTVTAGAGFAWTQITGPGIDLVHAAGRISATGGYTPFHTSAGSSSRLGVTTAGAVVMPENGQLYSPDGRFLAAFTGSQGIDCGSCATSAVGSRLLVEQFSGPPAMEPLGTWLWYPPAAIQRLPASYHAVGRLGVGWLGSQVGPGCWRTAPATAPSQLRATLCSMTTPLVGADGTRAVVVQNGQARVLDTRSGATVSRASLGALPGWQRPGAATTSTSAASTATTTTALDAPVRYVVPTAWADADTYLLEARDDTTIALVSCSVRTGTCLRVVRAQVRPGVDRIVTERGPEAITAR
jgi:hypothetical protein